MLVENVMRRAIVLIFCAWVVAACSDGGGASVLPVHAANPDSPYASFLAPCARESGDQRSCRFNQLPLLGMQTTAPDKAAVMDRVATTHPWMAQRFSELLDVMPPDLLTLMRSVTAIIIGADVRPSFYWSLTGAIYLDPAGLWLSVEEKRTIDPAPDYRSGFGNGLTYRVINRYVIDNDYAWYSYSLNDDSERTLDDIVLPVARLLYHELAHAADFLPADRMSGFNPTWTVLEATRFVENQGQQLSQMLEGVQPLNSQLMFDLAGVNFYGNEPTEAQRALQAPDVSAQFAPDGANDDYAYASRFEDVAMLFEETMMALSFGVERDVAVAPKPADGDPHIVDWGQRRRITDSQVIERARLVGTRILPDAPISSFLNSYGPPKSLASGITWNGNLDPDNPSKALASPVRQQIIPRDEVR